MSLAKRVRDCRFAKGWGPDELASRASISRTALYQIESGKTELPRAATLRRIAQALDVAMDVLLKDVDSTHNLGGRLKGVRGGSSFEGDHPLSNGWEDEAKDDHRTGSYSSLGMLRTTMVNGGRRPGRVNARNDQETDIEQKFRELLESPLGEGLARIVEESHRLLSQNSMAATS